MKKNESSTAAQRSRVQIKSHLDAALEISQDIGDPMLVYILRMAMEELTAKYNDNLK